MKEFNLHPFIVLSILSLTLCEEIPGQDKATIPSQEHLDSNDFQDFKSKDLITISKIAFDMSNAGVLASMTPIKQKLGDLTSKIEDTEMEIKKAEANKRSVKFVGNIGSTLAGLEHLASGIHTSSWQDIVLGGLDVAVPLASMAEIEDPLTINILSLVSAIFDVFGGSTGGEMSTESMIKRIIDFAIDQSNSKDIHLDASSTKRLYSSLSNNILQLRNGGGGVNKDQATEFFNQAFEEMAIFGKVEEIVTSSCNIGDVTRYDEAKLNQQTEKCLEFLNMYCSLSIIRQLLITDMASLVGEAGLNATSMFLLKLVRKKQEINKNILRFLVDPINYKGERYAVNYFYSSPERWPIIKAYIYRLDIESNGQFLPAHVVTCTKPRLQGECYQMLIGRYKSVDMMDWKDSISSIYIGGNLKVTGYKENKFKGKSYGPFIGPTVIGTIPGRNEWESIVIEPTQDDARQHLRICESTGLKQKGLCALLPIGDYDHLDKVDQNWSRRINSISIPSGMEVTAFENFNFQGTKFGPFRGPDTFNILCHGESWKSLKLNKISKSPASQMIRICREENFCGYCDVLEVKHLPDLSNIHGCSWNELDSKIKSMKIPGGYKVYMWTEKHYKGLPLGPYSGPSLVRLVDGAETTHVIRSIKIKRLY